MGDWNGSILLLAKDFAPASELQRLQFLGYGADEIYRHNDGDGRYKTGYRTNTRLSKFFFGTTDPISGNIAAECDIVYGSACFFLKKGDTSAKLTDWETGHPVFDNSAVVFQHVIANMPNLKAIVCLGLDALKLVAAVTGFKCPISVNSGIGRRLAENPLVYIAPHPSRGSNELHLHSWHWIKTDSGLATR